MLEQEQLNKKVNDYEPPNNFRVCGSYIKRVNTRPDKTEFIMKNNCEKWSLVHEWTFIADTNVWEEARSMPMFDEREFGGQKYTHLHSCTKVGYEAE